MNKISRKKLREKRRRRVRSRISGTAKKPRVSVFRSLRNLSVQLVDDSKGRTLASVTAKGIKASNNVKGAKELGKDFAKKCLKLKIDHIVFDRSGYKYHGKIKALAEGMKEGGIKF